MFLKGLLLLLLLPFFFLLSGNLLPVIWTLLCCLVCVFSREARPAESNELARQRKVPLTDTDLAVAATAHTRLQAASISCNYTVYILRYWMCLMLSA